MRPTTKPGHRFCYGEGQAKTRDDGAIPTKQVARIIERAHRESPLPSRKMSVGLTAAGFTGRFELPDKHFDDLLKWLVEHSIENTLPSASY